jgi:hypothetical protein
MNTNTFFTRHVSSTKNCKQSAQQVSNTLAHSTLEVPFAHRIPARGLWLRGKKLVGACLFHVPGMCWLAFNHAKAPWLFSYCFFIPLFEFCCAFQRRFSQTCARHNNTTTPYTYSEANMCQLFVSLHTHTCFIPTADLAQEHNVSMVIGLGSTGKFECLWMWFGGAVYAGVPAWLLFFWMWGIYSYADHELTNLLKVLAVGNMNITTWLPPFRFIVSIPYWIFWSSLVLKSFNRNLAQYPASRS